MPTPVWPDLTLILACTFCDQAQAVYTDLYRHLALALDAVDLPADSVKPCLLTPSQKHSQLVVSGVLRYGAFDKVYSLRGERASLLCKFVFAPYR
jgi:hypothetical protein